jgi:muramoyltetrapeptide carboxypeptidase
MLHKIYPSKLLRGDCIAVIAPSLSFSILFPDTVQIANKRFEDMRLKLEFGKHIKEMDEFSSSSIQSRIEDIHWAFSNPNIKAILTVIGGFNSNQLLKYIDWQIIKNNPKIFCGYSDITTLNNAIFKKIGLVTYSGPHYSSFGQKLNFDYTLDYFKKCLFSNEPFEVISSKNWSDDAWYLNQNDCNEIKNNGFYPINYGEASGTIVGANLVTFRTLQGTEYFPSLADSVLFIEDDCEVEPHHFDRDLQSLLLLEDFSKVKGIVFGRFQKSSKMTKELLFKIIASKQELKNIPIIADVDFGHTSPMITFPIGGVVYIRALPEETRIKITRHIE